MQHSTGNFYNQISFLYPAINFFIKGQRKILIKEINVNPAGDLLEIGVGQGSHLPEYHSHRITGIDVSEKMLKKARGYADGNVRLELMNGEDLSFPNNSFDYVVLSHVIAVAKDPGVLLEQVHRVLRPGGKMFILNHFTPDNWLRYIDWAFQPLSSIFHFKSLFYHHEIKELQRFSLLKKQDLGIWAYYKLLIYCKP